MATLLPSTAACAYADTHCSRSCYFRSRRYSLRAGIPHPLKSGTCDKAKYCKGAFAAAELLRISHHQGPRAGDVLIYTLTQVLLAGTCENALRRVRGHR